MDQLKQSNWFGPSGRPDGTEIHDKPLARNKHGCFHYKDEIIVFGGFGPRAANQFADSSEINDDGQGLDPRSNQIASGRSDGRTVR